jgi:uncharacterized protein YecT (DUF1311 family)
MLRKRPYCPSHKLELPLNIRALLSLAAIVVLSACDKKPPADGEAPKQALMTDAPMCSDPGIAENLKAMMLRKFAVPGMKQHLMATGLFEVDSGLDGLIESKLPLATAHVALELVTSAGYDEKIFKRTCNGQMKINGDTPVMLDVDYTIQLQEDKKDSVITTKFSLPSGSTSTNIPDWIQSFSISHMFKTEMEKQEEVMVQQANEKAQRDEAEEAQALIDQKDAKRNKAVADNALANQALNDAWGLVPKDQKETLLPQQRAWLKARDADCKIAASKASTDAVEKETARLECESKITTSRADELGFIATKAAQQ